MPAPISRSPAAALLYWPLTSPSLTSLSIMPNAHTPDTETLTPYTPDSTIANSPITSPAVPSLQVSISVLTRWEDDWKDMHREHEGQDPSSRVLEVVTDGGSRDFFDSRDQPVRVVRCCGEARPGRAEVLDVVASDGVGVTVDDYVKVVHPWLMRLKGDIFNAMKGYAGLRERDVLMVSLASPSWLGVEKRKVWKQLVRG